MGQRISQPGFGSRVLAFILRNIPKIGPANALDFKVPTTQTEDIYIKSVNQTTDNYFLCSIRCGKAITISPIPIVTPGAKPRLLNILWPMLPIPSCCKTSVRKNLRR